MVGWHHGLKGHDFEQTMGDSERQGSQGHCTAWGCKELNTTSQLKNNKNQPSPGSRNSHTHRLLDIR